MTAGNPVGWPARLREQIMEYNILDFSDWRDDTVFNQMMAKLIGGLDTFYQPEAHTKNQ